MRLRALHIATALALIWAGPVPAQTHAPAPEQPLDPDATEVEDVTVTGRVTYQAMDIYARTIGSGPAGRLSPRWHDTLCVRVVNMNADHAAYLKARIDTVARAVGLTPDPSPTCRPDVSIYASTDPDGLATTLVAGSPRGFMPARSNMTLGDEALREFQTTDDPIRWWQVSMPLMADTGQPAITLGVTDQKDPMALSIRVPNGSRLRGNVRDDLIGVTIIMDVSKLMDVPFDAVSDYVAFVALAPADPRVATGNFDTVLNLFDEPGVRGLSLMDEDYLYALYTASRAPASAALQASEIAGRMAIERRRRGAANH